jgi:hypothetical protein
VAAVLADEEVVQVVLVAILHIQVRLLLEE